MDPDNEEPPDKLEIESLVSVDSRSFDDDVDDNFGPELVLAHELEAEADVALENVVTSVLVDLVEASLGTNSSVDSAPEDDSEADLDEHGFDDSSFGFVVCDSAARKICSIILRAEAVGENFEVSLAGDGLICLLAKPGTPVRTGESMLLGTRFGSVGVDGVGGGATPANSHLLSVV